MFLLTLLSSDRSPSAGFDPGGQVAIGFSHWKSPSPSGGQNLPSPDCVHSEVSAVPVISDHLEPVSCPASLSITPLPTCSASQETLCDSSTSTQSVVQCMFLTTSQQFTRAGDKRALHRDNIHYTQGFEEAWGYIQYTHGIQQSTGSVDCNNTKR